MTANNQLLIIAAQQYLLMRIETIEERTRTVTDIQM